MRPQIGLSAPLWRRAGRNLDFGEGWIGVIRLPAPLPAGKNAPRCKNA